MRKFAKSGIVLCSIFLIVVLAVSGISAYMVDQQWQKYCPSGVPCHYPAELVEHPAKYRDLGFAVIGKLTFLEEQKVGDWKTFQYRLEDPRFWKDASIHVKLTVAGIPEEYKDDPYEWHDVVCFGVWKHEQSGYFLDAFTIGEC